MSDTNPYAHPQIPEVPEGSAETTEEHDDIPCMAITVRDNLISMAWAPEHSKEDVIGWLREAANSLEDQ